MQRLFLENYLDNDDYLHECDFFCFVTNNDTLLKRNVNESIKDTKISKTPKKPKKTKKRTLTKKSKKSTSKYCIARECEKYPSFNYFGKITPIYCSKHKLKNMVNVRAKQCVENNCTTSPSFNFSTKIEPIYCCKHKHDNMVNVKMFQCSKYLTKKKHNKK